MVLPDDVHVQVGDVLGGRGMTGVEEIPDRKPLLAGRRCRQPVAVSRNRRPVLIEHVPRIFGWGLVSPNRHRVDPGVDSKARAMGALGHIRQRIERRIVRRVVQRRFGSLCIQRITSSPYLDEQGVQIRSQGGLDELIGLERRSDAGMERIDPQCAQFRRSLR